MPDLKIDSNEILEILQILRKLPRQWNHMQMKQFYQTGIALYTKTGKSLVVYNKEEETKSTDSNFYGCEFYKNILRVEFRYKKYNLRYIAKQNNINLTLEDFVNEEMYKKYFIDEITKYFFYSNFVNLKTAIKSIRHSTYKDSLKRKLIKYVKEINKYGFQ